MKQCVAKRSRARIVKCNTPADQGGDKGDAYEWQQRMAERGFKPVARLEAAKLSVQSRGEDSVQQ